MTPRQSVDVLLVSLAGSLAPITAHAVPTLERLSDRPCRAIALDREPYWAALGDDAVTVNDKQGRHEEPLPEALRGPGNDLAVFFGRDYRIRIAGTAHTPNGDQARYYRSLPGGIRPAPDELGPLGKTGGPGLVALLGTADPEIVCRVGQGCLIKRTSGWAKTSAPSGLTRVGLSLGSGWAIAGNRFFTLAKDWLALPAGAWQRADDGFVRDDHACVVEHDRNRLHHYDGRAWHDSPSPVAGPRSLWGTDQSLWVAGDGGAASFEGGAFRKVEGPLKVVQVLGRTAGDVWLCSSDGVFRSKP